MRISLAYFLLVALFATTQTQAQTKIWGAGAATGAAHGEFQSDFVQSGTASNYVDTAWTALSISHGGGTASPGSAYWTRTLSGGSQGAYWASRPPISSPSQANGAAIFDSDFMDNAGTAGAFGTGTAPTPHRGELISPKIDLTGYTDSALVVQFYSYYREFRINELSVSLSVDGGVTWSTAIDYRRFQADEDQGVVRVLFLNETGGVANLQDCRVRFVFDDDYYFAILDDVTIEVAPAYDIALGLPDPSVNTLAGEYTEARVGNNRYLPSWNVDPTNLKEWFYGLKVVNHGSQDLLPTANPRIRMNIDYTDPVSGAVTQDVYVDTLALDTIPLGGLNGPVGTEALRDIAFLATHGEGNYTVEYWVEHDLTDGSTSNDTSRHVFTLTGNTEGNYLSKCRLSATDGKPFSSRIILPAGGPFQTFEYGSMFFFPKGTTDSVKIDSVSYRYYVSNNYTGAATQTLLISVYRWTDADNNGTMAADGSELTQVGIGTSVLNNLAAGLRYEHATVTNFIDASSGGAMAPFDDGGIYLVTILQSPSLVGGSGTFDDVTGLWFGADEYNYAINAGVTTGADPVPHPSPVKVLDASGTGDWNWVGFGGDLLPSLGLYLSNKNTPTSTIAAAQELDAEVALYPNPTNLYATIFSIQNALTNGFQDIKIAHFVGRNFHSTIC